MEPERHISPPRALVPDATPLSCAATSVYPPHYRHSDALALSVSRNAYHMRVTDRMPIGSWLPERAASGSAQAIPQRQAKPFAPERMRHDHVQFQCIHLAERAIQPPRDRRQISGWAERDDSGVQ